MLRVQRELFQAGTLRLVHGSCEGDLGLLKPQALGPQGSSGCLPAAARNKRHSLSASPLPFR
jgi:hypothetical protein